MSNKIHPFLSDFPLKRTAHLSECKRVFLKGIDENSSINEFAFDSFKSKEVCEEKEHSTITEYLYFITGRGKCQVDEEGIEILPNTFLRGPAVSKHNFINTGIENLEFILFDISI
ncbi:MAG: cupin domain-containing protein [Reichenbachiella sp.]